MYTRIGLVLGALGAILHFGVSNAVEGFNLNTIGIVLMAVGLVLAWVPDFLPGRSPRKGAVREEALSTLMADVVVISGWVDAVEDFADRAFGYADTYKGDPFFIELAGIVGHWSVLAAGMLRQSEQLRDQQLLDGGEGVAKLRERITVTRDAFGVVLAD